MKLPHANSYWVEPGGLMAGEYPFSYDEKSGREKLQRHLDSGITSFLDLTDPRDGLLPYSTLLPRDVAYTRMTITDMDVPTFELMAEIQMLLRAEREAERCVYVHCWGGIGRTGTVVGGYLVEQGMTGQQALDQIAQWWKGVAKSAYHPRAPQTDAQCRFVLDWAGRRRG